MTHSIVVYTETLNDNKQWEADQAYSYQMVSAKGNTPWPEMLTAVSIKPDPKLSGLLAMGVDLSFPFSFGIRNFPKNASKEVTDVYKEAEGESTECSWLTREELDAKAGMLLILGTEQSLKVRPVLTSFLNKLPEPINDDPTRQRIVFWFI